jgi:hypothetical protein
MLNGGRDINFLRLHFIREETKEERTLKHPYGKSSEKCLTRRLPGMTRKKKMINRTRDTKPGGNKRKKISIIIIITDAVEVFVNLRCAVLSSTV